MKTRIINQKKKALKEKVGIKSQEII